MSRFKVHGPIVPSLYATLDEAKHAAGLVLAKHGVVVGITDELKERLRNPRNRLARFYDDESDGERYTIVYLTPEKTGNRKWYPYRGCNECLSVASCSDASGATADFGEIVPVGRRNFLGKRITFGELPIPVQNLVISDLGQ